MIWVIFTIIVFCFYYYVKDKSMQENIARAQAPPSFPEGFVLYQSVDLMHFDITNKQIAVARVIGTTFHIISLKSVSKYELLEDNAVVASGGTKGAVVGGLLGGAAGALIGSTTGKSASMHCTDMRIRITYENLLFEDITFIVKPTARYGAEYNDALRVATLALSTIKQIVEAE